MNGGIFAGINQGLQNFINTQVAIHQLKRQEKQDALSLEKFRREMMLADYQLRKLEREEEDIKTIQEIGKSLPSTKKVIKIGGKEYTAKETEKALDEGIPYEVEERPMTLKERYEQMVEQLEKQGKFTLAAHFREKAEQAGLREMEIQRQAIEGIKNAYDVAAKLYRTGNKEGAVAYIERVSKQLGVPIDSNSIQFNPDNITLTTLNNRTFAIFPNGDIKDVTKEPPKTEVQLFAEKYRDPRTGEFDFDKAVKDYKNFVYGLQSIKSQGENKKIERIIRERTTDMRNAVKEQIDQIRERLKGITKEEPGILDFGRPFVYYKQVSPTRRMKITDPYVIEKIVKDERELERLTKFLETISEHVREDVEGGKTSSLGGYSKQYKDSKGNPVQLGVPYDIINEKGEKEVKVLQINPKTGKEEWINYSMKSK